MLGHYGLPVFDPSPERKGDYIAALEAADAALTTQGLLPADYWPHQTEALQPLIDFTGDALGESVEEATADPPPEAQ